MDPWNLVVTISGWTTMLIVAFLALIVVFLLVCILILLGKQAVLVISGRAPAKAPLLPIRHRQGVTKITCRNDR